MINKYFVSVATESTTQPAGEPHLRRVGAIHIKFQTLAIFNSSFTPHSRYCFSIFFPLKTLTFSHLLLSLGLRCIPINNLIIDP